MIAMDAATKKKPLRPVRRGRGKGKGKAPRSDQPSTRVPEEFEGDLDQEQREIYLEWASISGIKIATLCVLVKDAMVQSTSTTLGGTEQIQGRVNT